jgi:hypothetical protein
LARETVVHPDKLAAWLDNPYTLTEELKRSCSTVGGNIVASFSNRELCKRLPLGFVKR